LEINKCYNENCLDTMKKMPDSFIDLTVTSPPYDNLRTYNGYSFDFEAVAKELYRVTKQGGVVVWVVGDATIKGSETGTSFRQALFFKEIGFNLHDTMIYHKTNAPLTHPRYEQEFEYMFIFSKGRVNTFNGIKDKKNISFLEKLEKKGIKLLPVKIIIEKGKFTGLSFVITGVLDSMSRELAKEKIINQGGKVQEAISSKTDYLIIGKNPGSKYEKAKGLKTKIINEKEFLKML